MAPICAMGHGCRLLLWMVESDGKLWNLELIEVQCMLHAYRESSALRLGSQAWARTLRQMVRGVRCAWIGSASAGSGATEVCASEAPR